jgi:hypothetical protein
VRAAILLVLIGCGSDNPPGTLVCKASPDSGSPRVTIAVPAHQLAATRDNAERIGKLVDCAFEPTDENAPVRVELVELAEPTKRVDPPAPVVIDPPPPPPDPDDDDDDDVDDDSGVAGGVIGGVAPPPPPPPPAPPRNIPPTQLEGNRIAGQKNIQPDDDTQLEILQSGKSRIIGSFKLCVTATGEVSTVSMLKSTGFADYDNKLQTKMREWRYKPWIVNGDAIPVCTAVTFIYSSS